MKKIFYEKVGRRYKPISEYNSELLDGFPKGNHLVMCYPGGTSRRFNIDPAYAPMIAAGRVAEDAISRAIMKASDLRLGRKERSQKMTPGQIAAWENLVKEFGEGARQLEWPSAREAAEEAVKAMMLEAEQTLKNPAVKKAWDYFQMVYQLTKENQSE